jgi:predicted transcriptional regulator
MSNSGTVQQPAQPAIKKKLTVEMSPEELQILDTLAGKLKRNRSNTIRWTLEQALKRLEKEEGGQG